VLERLRNYPCALVFYEAPHRIAAMVAALAAVLGDERTLVVAREITKRFESIHRCRLGDAAAWFAEDDNRRKGEFVLIVDAPRIAEEADANAYDATLSALLDEVPLAQAVRIAVAITGEARNRLYDRALAIKNGLDLPRKGGAKQTP
jgi:16S rRNA (cytidine1402-2'-O)-methyltransferase